MGYRIVSESEEQIFVGFVQTGLGKSSAFAGPTLVAETKVESWVEYKAYAWETTVPDPYPSKSLAATRWR